MIVTENETRMIDSKFKTVKGFKAKHDKNISEPYKHIRVSNRDYIVGKNSNGKVSILNRRGSDRIKLPKDLTLAVIYMNMKMEWLDYFPLMNSLKLIFQEKFQETTVQIKKIKSMPIKKLLYHLMTIK